MSLFVMVMGICLVGLIVKQAPKARRYAVVDVMPFWAVTTPTERSIVLVHAEDVT